MFESLPSGNLPSINLKKLVAILAITAIVCFGLCAVGMFSTMSSPRFERYAGPFAAFCGVVVAICITGLVLIAVIAIIRAIFRGFSDKDGE